MIRVLCILFVQREVLEDIERKERQSKKESSATKKEVDFVPHTPPKVKSKNVAGPPVYYPPGSAEFTKKEESSVAMSQASVSHHMTLYDKYLCIIMEWPYSRYLINRFSYSSFFQGGWEKASGKYEYEASSKSKSKSSKGGAVVPVCLPLCCALPCVIM